MYCFHDSVFPSEACPTRPQTILVMEEFLGNMNYPDSDEAVRCRTGFEITSGIEAVSVLTER